LKLLIPMGMFKSSDMFRAIRMEVQDHNYRRCFYWKIKLNFALG
jgi:hypothetical protein